MTDDGYIKATQRILNQSRVASTKIWPGSFVRDTAAFEATVDYFTDSMLVALSAYVLTEQLVNERQTVEIAVPATWWQHFKRDHLKWYAKRRPVRYEAYTKQVTFNAKATYPSSNFALPEEKFGKPVLFETFEQTPWHINDRRQP